MYLAFNHFYYFHHQETFINSKKASIHNHSSYSDTIAYVAALESTISPSNNNRTQFHKVEQSTISEQQSTLNLSCFQENDFT